MKSLSKIIIGLSSFTPIFAFAQVTPPSDFKAFVQIIIDIGKLLIPVLIGILLLVFIWGLVVFIKNAANEEKRNEGKKLMFWGIISLFVAVSIWGIVTLLTSSFGFGTTVPQLPGLDETGGGLDETGGGIDETGS